MDICTPITILLAEDNEDDVYITKEELRRNKLLVNLVTVPDGMEAMAYLNKQGKYKDAKIPDLLLLDLNMPKKDGMTVLKEIKNDPGLSHLPVVVFTISDSDMDILKSYNLKADSYITKPIDMAKFVGIVNAVKQFRFAVVSLPESDRV